jgi:hypothetical protein
MEYRFVLLYFIGDRFVNTETANRIGFKSILVPAGEPEISLFEVGNRPQVCADFVCRCFSDAVDWLLADKIRLSKISVVIPVFNEEKALPYMLTKIPGEYEVMLVDGHSTDNTTL